MILGMVVSFAMTCKNHGKEVEEDKPVQNTPRSQPVRKAD